MLQNYLKVVIRNLNKHRTTTLINISGLAIGMTCCLLIMLFVRQELDYDKYHQNYDRIYRLNIDYITPNSNFSNALSSAPMGPYFQEEFPEILASARVHRPLTGEVMIRANNKSMYESRFVYGDPALLEIFSFPMVQGTIAQALQSPNAVIISESTAKRYFGDNTPLGKNLILENQQEFQITGVFQDIPANSHLQFDFLASFSSLESQMGSDLQNWQFNPFYTYFLLEKNASPEHLAEKLDKRLSSLLADRIPADQLRLVPNLQALPSIHLHPQGNDLPGGRSIMYVYIFAIIAILILLIAGVNFVNLSTSRSLSRAKEVGLRKVVGATRPQLITQFLGESTLQALISFLVALMLVEISLPYFNQLSGLSIDFTYSENITLIALSVVIFLIFGLLAGIYPAFLLSAYRPVHALQGSKTPARNQYSLKFRQVMVIFQFTVSIALIASSLLIFQQINFMKNKPLGFTKESVIAAPLRGENLQQQYTTLRNELLQSSDVSNVGLVNLVPGKGAWGTSVYRPTLGRDSRFSAKYLLVDEGFIPTLEISISVGRNFSSEHPTDSTEALILNETAAKQLGWLHPEDALGEQLVWAGQQGVVIGVVKDFHFQAMRIHMQPLVLKYAPLRAENLLVRINSGNASGTLSKLQAYWTANNSEWPFIYSFLAQDINALYLSETQLADIMTAFTVLAIFIACLGLFGLTAFSVERRIKEIGIRKVLGASVNQIVGLISRDFILLIIIANIFAWPGAYFSISRWLESFAFRTEINGTIFLQASGLVLIIALLTISYQAIKAAYTNPTKVLKHQ